MRRRQLISTLACLPASFVLAQDEPRPRHKISAGELHEALSRRFPLRGGPAGLLEVQVSAPRLHMLPARNKLGAMLVMQAEGQGLQALPPAEVDLVFAVRYEGRDRSLRAHQPEVLDVRMPGLAPSARQLLQGLLPAIAREAIGEVVVHKFTERELALPDTMGFEPEKVTVVDDGLLVGFGPKPRR